MFSYEFIRSAAAVVTAASTLALAIGVILAGRQLKHSLATTFLDVNMRLGNMALLELSNHEDSFFEDLYEEDAPKKELRLKVYAMTQLIFFEYVWGARRAGEVADSDWPAWARHIGWFCRLPRVREVWPELSQSFDVDFQIFVEDLMQGKEGGDPCNPRPWSGR